MDFVFRDLAVFELAHQGGGAQRDLVHTVAAVDHHGVFGAQTLQCTHLDAHQIGMKHAHQDVGCRGRVGQRPQDVEDGFDAQFAAHRGHGLHRRMVVGGEHEAHADLIDAARDHVRRQIDIDAQALEHVGAAAFARHAAPAVLAHLGACCGGHEHGAGGDVESVGAVTAGAHDVNQVGFVGHLDLGRKLAHHLGRGRDLADGLFLHPQAGDQRRHHHRRHLAAHDHAHEVQHFVVEDLAVLDGALQGFLRGDFLCAGHRYLQKMSRHQGARGTGFSGPMDACSPLRGRRVFTTYCRPWPAGCQSPRTGARRRDPSSPWRAARPTDAALPWRRSMRNRS